MKIKAGMILVCDTLSWDDGWEFDRPSMMLAPVLRCFETAKDHEQIVEDVLIDTVVEGELRSQSFEQTWGWRGYNLKTLQRAFREALAGKNFPKRGYVAKRETVRIVDDGEGGLTWETIVDWRRACGDCVCEKCGKKYFDHPHDNRPEVRSYDGSFPLRRLCDGRSVKL